CVKTIPKPIWTAILQDLSKTSSFAISVASGSFPPEEQIAQVFSDNGVLLFPDRQGELHTKCTCLDWSNPCKHIAAVYLLLGAEFDRDPFLLFKLRGLAASEFFQLSKPAGSMQKSALHNEAAAETETSSDSSSAFCRSAPLTQTGLSIEGVSAETEPDPSSNQEMLYSTSDWCRQFWKTSLPTSQILGHWTQQSAVASLPSSLGPFPFWQGTEDFLDRIRSAYETAPEQAKTVLVKRD
ncbi:MAG: SWIM zinc finger family protein, partial [Terriglobales bacterium]